MASKKRCVTAVVFITLFNFLLLLAVAGPSRAQATPPTDEESYLLGTNGDNPAAVPSPAIASQSPTVNNALGPPQAGPTGPDETWHFAVSPYLWFPGVHGTAVGLRGNGLSFRASPGDLLSNARFGLMGAVEARRKRVLVSGDLLWIRLEADKAIPVLGTAGNKCEY
jgi:hypothetical protein